VSFEGRSTKRGKKLRIRNTIKKLNEVFEELQECGGKGRHKTQDMGTLQVWNMLVSHNMKVVGEKIKIGKKTKYEERIQMWDRRHEHFWVRTC
jgi:hypothetical protein